MERTPRREGGRVFAREGWTVHRSFVWCLGGGRQRPIRKRNSRGVYACTERIHHIAKTGGRDLKGEKKKGGEKNRVFPPRASFRLEKNKGPRKAGDKRGFEEGKEGHGKGEKSLNNRKAFLVK